MKKIVIVDSGQRKGVNTAQLLQRVATSVRCWPQDDGVRMNR